LSLSISGPHIETILSSSLAVMAAMQGAVSTCESVAGSVPVAPQPGDSIALNMEAVTAFRTSTVKQRRIDFTVSARVGAAMTRRTLHVVPANEVNSLTTLNPPSA
jgi:hypothetical protein